METTLFESDQWHSIGCQLVFHWKPIDIHWQSIDIPLAAHWHFIWSQLTLEWKSIDFSLAVNWHFIGSQLAFHWQSIDIPVAFLTSIDTCLVLLSSSRWLNDPNTMETTLFESHQFHSIGFQLAFHWKTISISLEVNWPSMGSPLTFHWKSIDIPLAVHWHFIGSQ